MDTVKALAGDKFDQAKFDELKDADGFVTKEALLALAAPIEPTEPTESAAVTEAEPVAAKEAPAPITMKAEEIQQKVEVELAKANEAMVAAEEALKCLDKNIIKELKGFKMCPGAENGNKVVSACLILLEKNYSLKLHNDLPKCWDTFKKMMADPGQFLVRLQNVKGEDITEQEIEMLTERVENDPDFNYERIVKASQALAIFAKWVINIYKYNRMYVQVAPLMASLKEATDSKAAADAALANATAIV